MTAHTAALRLIIAVARRWNVSADEIAAALVDEIDDDEIDDED